MGRKRKNFRKQGANSRDGGEWQEGRQTYVLAPKENKLFEQYYQGQGLVPETEWDDFMEKLRQPLPSTFRITGFRSHASELLRIMKNSYLKELVEIEIDGRFLQPARCLSWYPGELAWQLDLHRKLIRQNDSLKKLHQFLIQETESGNISRQEAVSMIPPLLLDVRPNSRVLDMCAAPGSKSAQLIEMLHANEEKPVSGYVIANDADNKRCYLMVHQLSRLSSPNFMISNMDASNLPNFTSQVTDTTREIIKFDRILCDVPCSGDGTLRKNVDAWHRWNPAIAHGLHNLQVRILRRGIDLLEVGGRIVYSTCSFNPVEDEAVVSCILQQMNGSVELVDVSSSMPDLHREKGVLSWKVMTKQGVWFETYEQVPERNRTEISASVFPPSHEQAVKFGLDRCLRILPHKQDTGGFFVAVLEKRAKRETVNQCVAATEKAHDTVEAVKPDNSSTNAVNSSGVADVIREGNSNGQTEQQQANQNVSTDSSKRKMDDMDDKGMEFKKGKYYGYREDPFIFLKSDDPICEPLRKFYGISSDFPFDQLMVRCEMGKKRNIYFVSTFVKKLLQENEHKFKFINLGVKVLSRSESKGVDCDFRLVQEGLHIMYPYISKRIVKVGSKDDIVTLLSCENPYVSRMTKITQEQLHSFDQGGCIFVYEPTDSGDGPQCQLVVCGWKGKISCRSFLAKFERGHYLRLCGTELKSRDERQADKLAAETALRSTELGDSVTSSDEVLALEDAGDLQEACPDAGEDDDQPQLAVDGSDSESGSVEERTERTTETVEPQLQ